MDSEIWKAVEECPEYEISSFGRVRRASNGRIRKLAVKNGYLQVALWVRPNVYHRNIHRLVALAFVPNPENKPCVNHIDGNRMNNTPANLEWVTYHENTQHGMNMGLLTKGEDRYNSKLTESAVLEILASSEHYDVLASRYGVSRTCIYNVRKRISWRHIT